MKKILAFLCSFIFIFSCSTNIFDPQSPESISNSTTLSKMKPQNFVDEGGTNLKSNKFIVPDSIPEEVKLLSEQFAPSLDEFTIRYLLLDTPTKNLYVMSYHQKEAKALKTVYCNFDISTKIAVIVPVSKLIKDNSQFQTILADSGGGGGGGGGYTFHVATFWKDAYFNGSSLDIWEICPGVGYYIYYNNNLQNYGFNDCLSSHKGFVWNSNDGPLKSTVYEVKVWKNCDRGGSSHTFTGDKSRYDNNWIDEQLGFPDYTTINDQVSSFEIKYRVENY